MATDGRRPPAGFGKGVNDYLNHYITLTDGKAGAFLAASLAVGALVVSKDWQTTNELARLARFASVALLAASATCAAWVVFPRLPSGRRGVLFWEDIRSHGDVVDYETAVGELDEAAVEREYAAQNFVVSGVVHQKMKVTRAAIWLFLLGTSSAAAAALGG